MEHKLTEYCRKSESLTIYHIGVHRCLPKPVTHKYSKQIRNAVPRNSGVDTCDIQQAEVGQVVAMGDIKEAGRRAMQLSYTYIRSMKAKVACERNPDKNSLEVVGILKQATHKEGKYLIYKIYNWEFNRKLEYVFYSSTPMTQLAIDMDQDGPKYPLWGQKAYFNGVIHNVCHIKL